MVFSLTRLGAAALVGLTLLGPVVPQARAQRVNLAQSIAQQNAARPPGYIPPNRYYLTPSMTQGQYNANLASLGRAYSQVPPYALGYNPYPQLINYGTLYRTNSPVYSSIPYSGLSNSYLYGNYSFNPLLNSSSYPSYSLSSSGY